MDLFSLSTRGGYWVMPLLTIVFIIWILIEGASISRSKAWYKSIRDKDERTETHTQKAGYVTFYINIIAMALLFVFYSYISTDTFNPLNFAGIIFIINIVTFNTLKIYYIHNK
jgi:cytochrome b561